MSDTADKPPKVNTEYEPKRLWTSDFALEGKGLRVKKTGHWVPLNLSILHDFFSWFSFYTLAASWRLGRRLTGKGRPTIAFFPDKPRPWYFVWPVIHVAGVKLIDKVEQADIVFQFDDSTESEHVIPKTKDGARLVNMNCRDVSKSRVAEAFAAAAGYSLAVDPTVFNGKMVEKSELNAAHDGRIVQGPIAKGEDGKVYQRLIDNEIEGGLVEDLRACIVGGKPAIVLRKRRNVERRFMNENAQVILARPTSCYSAEEIDVICRFADEMGLEWGGVDVLRDGESGQIFIVDANKTDMGPPIALNIGRKLRATRWMAHAFAAAFMDNSDKIIKDEAV